MTCTMYITDRQGSYCKSRCFLNSG